MKLLRGVQSTVGQKDVAQCCSQRCALPAHSSAIHPKKDYMLCTHMRTFYAHTKYPDEQMSGKTRATKRGPSSFPCLVCLFLFAQGWALMETVSLVRSTL